MNNFRHNYGFAVLTAVVLVGAAALVVVLSISFLAINSWRNVQVVSNSEKAKGLANACSELALEQIRSVNNYVGNGNLNLNGIVCNYTVINLGGSIRQINVTGEANQIIRKVKITTSAINPRVILSSWQEVADF